MGNIKQINIKNRAYYFFKCFCTIFCLFLEGLNQSFEY